MRFGAGRIAELPEAVNAAGMRRPLLVTDPRLAAMPMVTEALARPRCRRHPLRASSPTCARTRSPPMSRPACAALRAGGHDGVVAFGGGSALDVGKVIAFMAGQTRPMWDFEDVGDWWTRADPNGIAPIVAVPTTAGTGSEVGRAGVITDEATHTKKMIFHPAMMPRITICDPELTTGMPPAITAGTGMDALAHCLEAYCGPSYHPLADGIAVEGMRLVKESLVRAVADGQDLEARAHMMAAALMGATAFQKALGAIHALSHPVGRALRHASRHDQRRVHALCARLQPPGHRDEDRAPCELSRPCRRASMPSSSSSSTSGSGAGVPHALPGLGVDGAQIDRIAAMAPQDPTAGGNPVPLDERGARAIFVKALDGSL